MRLPPRSLHLVSAPLDTSTSYCYRSSLVVPSAIILVWRARHCRIWTEHLSATMSSLGMRRGSKSCLIMAGPKAGWIPDSWAPFSFIWQPLSRALTAYLGSSEPRFLAGVSFPVLCGSPTCQRWLRSPQAVGLTPPGGGHGSSGNTVIVRRTSWVAEGGLTQGRLISSALR